MIDLQPTTHHGVEGAMAGFVRRLIADRSINRIIRLETRIDAVLPVAALFAVEAAVAAAWPGACPTHELLWVTQLGAAPTDRRIRIRALDVLGRVLADQWTDVIGSDCVRLGGAQAHG